MNNPISQIERTKDAYAGNIQGLQKRANVSKELIDLLAMQQLKKDLDAAKRNQMMQMQGNPATVKDQLQQGLMGEYRQQAAKEMGMMPAKSGYGSRPTSRCTRYAPTASTYAARYASRRSTAATNGAGHDESTHDAVSWWRYCCV